MYDHCFLNVSCEIEDFVEIRLYASCMLHRSSSTYCGLQTASCRARGGGAYSVGGVYSIRGRGAGRTQWLLALVVRPLATYPFRDGAGLGTGCTRYHAWP